MHGRFDSSGSQVGYGSDFGLGGRAGPGGSADFASAQSTTAPHSDALIKEAISTTLAQADVPHLNDLSVELHSGVATLTGLVDSNEMGERVEALIRSVPDVIDVANRLTVRPPGFEQLSP